MVTREQLALEVGRSVETIDTWRKRGLITGKKIKPQRCWIVFDPEDVAKLKAEIAKIRRKGDSLPQSIDGD